MVYTSVKLLIGPLTGKNRPVSQAFTSVHAPVSQVARFTSTYETRGSHAWSLGFTRRFCTLVKRLFRAFHACETGLLELPDWFHHDCSRRMQSSTNNAITYCITKTKNCITDIAAARVIIAWKWVCTYVMPSIIRWQDCVLSWHRPESSTSQILCSFHSLCCALCQSQIALVSVIQYVV